MSDFVGSCFLPEFFPPAALSTAFSPLVNTNILSEDIDEPDETPHEEMNVIRAIDASRWMLGSSTWSGGFAELCEEESGVSGCCLAGAILSVLPNGPSVILR